MLKSVEVLVGTCGCDVSGYRGWVHILMLQFSADKQAVQTNPVNSVDGVCWLRTMQNASRDSQQ